MTMRPSQIAVLLGLAGLLPFAGAAAGIWAWGGGYGRWAAEAVGLYGALILTFVGALYWGLALRAEVDAARALYAWSVTPALWAWFAVLLPVWATLPLLAVGFVIWHVVERGFWRVLRPPVWFRQFRLWLTAGAAILLLLSGWGLPA